MSCFATSHDLLKALGGDLHNIDTRHRRSLPE